MKPDRPILSLEELEAFDPHASQGAGRRFCCPLCGQDKPRDGAHRCLSLDSQGGLWRCFRCEAGGRLREKWPDKPLHRRVQAQRAMQGAFGLDEPSKAGLSPFELQPPHEAAGPTAPSSDSLRPAPEPRNGSKHPWRAQLRALQLLEGSPAQRYLEGRRLSLEVCLAAKVKFSRSWLGRPAAVFPLYDGQGALVAAQGRYLDGRGDPKARTLGRKKEGVFVSGRFWEQVQKGAPLVITEAPIDALSLASCGFPALALCGKSGWPLCGKSGWPLWLPIKCAFKDVVLAFDADGAGEDGAACLLPVLAALGAKVRRATPEGAKDWNEMLVQRGGEELDEWLCARLLSSS